MATIADKETGAPHAVPRNQFIEIDDDLYYFDSEGKPLTGKSPDGKEYYFRENGSAREEGTLISFGTGPYYDKKTGAAVYKAGLVEVGNWCYINDKSENYFISKILMANSTILKILEPSITLQGISLKTKYLVLRLKTMIDAGQQNTTEVVKSRPYAYYYFDADLELLP
ncbi:MAG: hypothetical protein ACLRSA_02035 [Streptococcus salivarius]